MDNQDFDKILSDKLQETQTHEFIESDWEQVSERLHPPVQKKKQGFWFFFLPFALFSLCGTIAGLTFQLKKTNQQLDQLQQTLSHWDQNQKDTVYKTTTIVQIDTIIQHIPTTTNNKPISSHTFTANQQSFSKNHHNPNITTNNLKSIQSFKVAEQHLNTGIVLDQNEPTVFTIQPADSDATLLFTNNDKNTALLGNRELTFIPVKSLDFYLVAPTRVLPFQEEEIDLLPNKKIKKPVFMLKNASIGIVGGGAFTNSYSSVSSAYNIAVTKKSAWDLGVRLAYQLTPEVNGFADIAFQTLNYQTSDLDSIWGIPMVDLASDPTTISDARLSQQAIHYRFGFQYTFLKNKKWHPIIGLAIEAQSHLKQNISVFTLENYGLANSNHSFNTTTFRFHSIVPALGLKLNLNKKIDWQIETWYQHILWKNPQQIYAPFGIRTHVSYRF